VDRNAKYTKPIRKEKKTQFTKSVRGRDRWRDGLNRPPTPSVVRSRKASRAVQIDMCSPADSLCCHLWTHNEICIAGVSYVSYATALGYGRFSVIVLATCHLPLRKAAQRLIFALTVRLGCTMGTLVRPDIYLAT